MNSLSRSLLLGLLMVLHQELAHAQFSTKEYSLSLHSEKLVFSPTSTAGTLQSLKTIGSEGLHAAIKTYKNLTKSEKTDLEKIGLKVLSPIKHSTYLAKISFRFNPTDKTAKKHIANIAQLKGRHKTTPALLDKAKTEKVFIITPSKGAPYNYVVNRDGSLKLLVQFYEDIDEKTAKSVLKKYSNAFVNRSSIFWEISLSRDAMLQLADEDAILFVDAIDLPFMPDNDETREIVHANEVQEFSVINGQINGLGGQGVDVGIFDGGVDSDHGDFNGRVKLWSERKSKHGTHVAGIVLGDGRQSNQNDNLETNNGGSAYQWRGLAPQAKLIDAIGGKDNLTAKALSKYIRDYGLDISNHSYSFSYDGIYSEVNVLVDSYVNGSLLYDDKLVPARLVVCSAGNHGASPLHGGEQVGYFSMTKQMKNAIMVGNFDTSGDNFLTWMGSSLGPTYDGRLKPDVVAPGRRIISTGYCDNTDPNDDDWCPEVQDQIRRNNYYRAETGTSMAAPVVTGALALVLQRWAIVNRVNLNGLTPLPSTLRAIVIHTARDIVSDGSWFNNADGPVQAFIGPDFTTGWGMVDAQAAVNVISERRVIESNIAETCNTAEYSFYIGTTAGELKATLAWDDIASTPLQERTEPLLINDLDLELIDPNGNIHYPWLLNHQVVNALGNVLTPNAQICGSDLEIRTWLNPTLEPNFDEDNNENNVNDDVAGLRAAERGKDHLNNIEVVQAPRIAGTWKAIVRGFNIVEGPQNFSLILPKSDFFTSMRDFCNVNSFLCKKFEFEKICERRPELCSPPRIIPGKLGPKIKFRSKDECIIIQVNKICQYVTDCLDCKDRYCAGYDIQMKSMPDGFKIEVFDNNAKRIFKDHSTSKNKGFKFQPKPENDYFLVIRPGEKTEVDKEYFLPITIRPF